MSTELKPLEFLKQEIPTIEALIKLNAKPGVDVATLAQQELDYLGTHAISKPEILQCIPLTIILAVKTVLKQNLSLDPYAALVYVKTRNVKTTDHNGRDAWKKALEIQPSANGLISIARQCGRILDMKRPEVTKNEHGRVISVCVEFLLPSIPEPRWEKFVFDEDDFYRWRRASDKENGRNKTDGGGDLMKYANENYTNWKGGIDPEFARAKAIRHGLKKLGTNQNELRMDKITFTAKNITVDIDPVKDEATATEEVSHEEISSTNNTASTNSPSNSNVSFSPDLL